MQSVLEVHVVNARFFIPNAGFTDENFPSSVTYVEELRSNCVKGVKTESGTGKIPSNFGSA